MSNYIIGDVHGCYDALMLLLGKLNVQKDDQVWFVGDIIGHFRNSAQMRLTIEWFVDKLSKASSGFHVIKGNHDVNDTKWLYNKVDKYTVEEFEYIIGNAEMYHTFRIGESDVMVTHSWLVDSDGRSCITDPKLLNPIKSYEDDSYSRTRGEHTIQVVHGHVFDAKLSKRNCNDIAPMYKAKYVNTGNLNIDCGMFIGLRNGGNLCAYCIESDTFTYAYTIRDYWRECQRVSMKAGFADWEVMMASHPAGVDLPTYCEGLLKKYLVYWIGDYGHDRIFGHIDGVRDAMRKKYSRLRDNDFYIYT